MRIWLHGAAASGAESLAFELGAELAARGIAANVQRAGSDAAARSDANDIHLLASLEAVPPAALAAAQDEDAALRERLQRDGVRFRVVYGDGAARLTQALRAVDASLAPRPATPARAWRWDCEKCSDPECEHRLFRRLVDARAD